MADRHRLDGIPGRAAPPTLHAVDALVEDFLVLHREVAAHAEVVERPRSSRRHDVEAREVAAPTAAVPDGHPGSLRLRGPAIRALRTCVRYARGPMPEWFPHLEPAGQRTFTDLGTPLHEVTFVVVDLETTCGAPATRPQNARARAH